MARTLCFALAAYFALAACIPMSPPSQVVGAPRYFQPRQNSKWEVTGPADLTERRSFFVALRERNLNELRILAEAISEPDSAAYGEHLSFEQLMDLTAPSQVSVERVTRWLRSQGLTNYEVKPAGGFIQVEATHAQIERAFQCRLKSYSHPDAKNLMVRSETPYHIPHHLNDVIDYVAPLHGFPNRPYTRRAAASRPVAWQADSDPVSQVTPAILRSRYNITGPYVDLKVNNTQAVFEIEESISDDDLQSFYQQFAPKLVGQKVSKFLGDGNPSDNIGTESSLDIQYIAGLGGYAPNYYYNYNEDDVFAAFYKYALDLINDPRPPLVHSISYGQYGGDYPIQEVDRISSEFMKLGTRGITVLVASGDDGVGCNEDGTSFEFPYPSTPWVTFLGSTSLQTRSDGKYTEIGSTFSTGGFSGDFPTAPWQAAAVATFLKTPNLPTSYFNASGRGLPDLSTAGEQFAVVVDGEVSAVDGTSCSAPTFGGMVSLINGQRLKAGKTSVGFINPLLYRAAQLFPTAYYDVTSGNNAVDDCPGFNAVKGWDPVTGLGTPNFPVLLRYALSLP